MGVILFGIYIVLSIVLTVIGVFIGNIIFFDSILLAALSGLLCHTLWTVHPAFCLLIGIAVFLLLFWLQHTGVGFWTIGGLVSCAVLIDQSVGISGQGFANVPGSPAHRHCPLSCRPLCPLSQWHRQALCRWSARHRSGKCCTPAYL